MVTNNFVDLKSWPLCRDSYGECSALKPETKVWKVQTYLKESDTWFFDTFYQNSPPGPHLNRQKRFSEIFRWLLTASTRCRRGRWLCGLTCILRMLLNVLQNSFVGKEAAVGIPLEQLFINNSVDLSMTAMTTRSTVWCTQDVWTWAAAAITGNRLSSPYNLIFSVYIYREREYICIPNKRELDRRANINWWNIYILSTSLTTVFLPWIIH